MLSVVISLQTAAQKAILARSHDVQASQLVTYSCLSTPFDLRVCSYQRSTLAYMELSPAKLRSLDVTGRFTSEH